MIEDHIILVSVNVLLAWSVYIALMSGSLSFAASASMGLGCYLCAVLTVKSGWSLYPSCVVALVLTGLIGALIGFPALRVKGIFLMLVTLGVAVSIIVVFENVPLFGGAVGIGGMPAISYQEAIVWVFIVGAGLFAISRTSLQRLLDATREDELVAKAVGVNTVAIKVAAFAASAMVAAIAGIIYGRYLGYIRPETFSVNLALFAVMYVILGGVNNLWGPAVGATVLTLLPEYVSFLKDWRPTVFSAAVVLMLLIRPEGLLSLRPSTVNRKPKGNDGDRIYNSGVG